MKLSTFQRLLAALVAGCAAVAARAADVDYTKQIKPLLSEKCSACHGALKQKADLRIDAIQLLRKGGENGATVVAGHADDSLFIHAIEGTHDATKMPKDGAPLTDEQVKLVRAWIDQGAKGPAEETIPADPRQHWSFKQPIRPAVPAVKNERWVRNPIDAFVAAQQEKVGVMPLPEAPRSILLRRLEYPGDDALRARIKSYELAFRMQSAVPETMRCDEESPATQSLYGLDKTTTKPFGQLCLAARRLSERGVRFVQVYHGSNGGAGAWDSHSGLKAGHARLAGQTDQPIAALLKDLKARGLLDETLVVWGTEFGRTPGAQGADGRDHHPFGFSIFMAGGGIKGGVVHGATDELGFHAVVNRHYITDLHATVLNQLGLDTRRLVIPGRKRLEMDFGNVIKEIIA